MKKFLLATAACTAVLAAGATTFAPAANASSAGPTILTEIGYISQTGSSWKSTPSHTPDIDYEACVAVYGYEEADTGGGGWNISYRYSSSHISFWTGPSYHHNVSSYCGPWKTDSKSSTYTRFTVGQTAKVAEADVWQYWN